MLESSYESFFGITSFAAFFIALLNFSSAVTIVDWLSRKRLLLKVRNDRVAHNKAVRDNYRYGVHVMVKLNSKIQNNENCMRPLPSDLTYSSTRTNCH